MPRNLGILFALTVLLTSSDSLAAQASSNIRPGAPDSDSTAAVQTVSRFHAALKAGDTATVKTLIAPDLQVLEGGEVETRAQYLAHHLGADMEFAKAVQGESSVVSYRGEGNVAWLASTSTATGKFNGRDVNSVGAELMVLSRTPEGWKIRAIHWSSARRQLR